MEVFAFGPFQDEPLRLGPKIDFWPVRTDAIEQLLQGMQPLERDTLGAPQRGLPAIEYILFRPDAATILSDGSRACEYLEFLADDLLHHAEDMRTAWDPTGQNFLGELISPTGASFSDRHAALSEVANRMAFTIEDIRADKLGAPLGETTGGSPLPDNVESRFSARSIGDIRDNLLGIEWLYFGTGVDGSVGLSFYSKERGQDFDAAFAAHLRDARVALDAIPEPLTEAVSTSPAKVAAAIETLAAFQRLLQVDIIGALALTPRFNDNDGD